MALCQRLPLTADGADGADEEFLIRAHRVIRGRFSMDILARDASSARSTRVKTTAGDALWTSPAVILDF